jgi:DNA (cytosine-5)-methyltransferase 1
MTDKLRVLDLFSGIGGFSLGLERTGGFETVAFCEIEPFPRKVLAKHWPEVPQYEDVTKLTGDILRRDGISVDVITGGFPCQDISVAGKQAGIGEGTRSGLWSEIVRLIGELAPSFVIVENVAALLSGPSEQRGGWFGSILGDLAECGYDAEWENIPAAAVGAPHRRERVWIVAYPNNLGGPSLRGKREDFAQQGVKRGIDGIRSDADAGREVSICGTGEYPEAMANASSQRQQGQGQLEQSVGSATPGNRQASILGSIRVAREWCPEPDVGRVANGVSQRVDRLKGLGNAVVPQIPELIGNAILKSLSR